MKLIIGLLVKITYLYSFIHFNLPYSCSVLYAENSDMNNSYRIVVIKTQSGNLLMWKELLTGSF
jgi:hypothetical protein